MTWEQLEARINKKSEKVLFDTAQGFMTDIMIAPIVSHDLENAYRNRKIKGGYAVTNHMIYAGGIFVGRPYGVQVPNGHYPNLNAWRERGAKMMAKVLS